MDNRVFIVLAYGVAGISLALLCVVSWARYRSVSRQLDNHSDL